MVVIAPPLMADVPVTVSELSGALLPTSPPNAAGPATVRSYWPFKFPSNATDDPVSVAPAPSTTAPLYSCAPLVVIAVVWIWLVPSTVSDASAAPTPTWPLNTAFCPTVRP